MKIKISVGTNRVGSTVERILEIDDDTTPDEIDAMAWDYAMELIDYTYEIIEYKGKELV
jgi:hypothetical protein